MFLKQRFISTAMHRTKQKADASRLTEVISFLSSSGIAVGALLSH
jgi:hypothetical protein